MAATAGRNRDPAVYDSDTVPALTKNIQVIYDLKKKKKSTHCVCCPVCVSLDAWQG